MNEELIKTLWWKARIGYNNQNCDPEVLAKFTELIVNECALQCNHNDDMDRILEHFGVEE